jgi:hypothetical protein
MAVAAASLSLPAAEAHAPQTDVDAARISPSPTSTDIEATDALEIMQVQNARFKVNWNFDKWDRDSITLKFIARLPKGFDGFSAETEATVEFGDYLAWSSDEKVRVSKNGLNWRSKEGDARFDEDGDRMDVPVTVIRICAIPEKALLFCKLKVRYDDCIGSDFDVDDATYNMVTNYPVEVELTTGNVTYIGHTEIPMYYTGNPIVQRGRGRMVR